MKLKLNLKDIYEEETLVYYAGGFIEGDLSFELSKETECKCLYVEANGYVQIRSSSGFFEKTYVLEKKVSLLPRDNMRLAKGYYSYPFRVDLPCRLPQTNKYNCWKDIQRVRYYCKATFQATRKAPVKCKEMFTLKRCDYSNFYPLLRLPIVREIETRFYGLVYRSEEVTMRVSLPYSGIAVGETIPISISFDNKSDIQITQTKIQFVESEVYYKLSTPAGVRKDVLVEEINVGAKPREKREIIHDLTIPRDVFMSDLLFVPGMAVLHSIVITAKPRGLHRKLKAFIPIIIGAVRWEHDINEDQPISQGDNEIIIEHLQKSRFFKHMMPY